MQNAPQVAWDNLDVIVPWPHRLFVFYVVVVVVISAVKSASALRQLLLRGSSLRAPKSDDDFLRTWEKCSNRIQSMKRIVVTTLLLSFLIPAYMLLNGLENFAHEKVFSPGAFLGIMIEVLTVFVLGILACTLIYATCVFLEEALVRRIESWRSSGEANENRSAGNSGRASLL